MNPALSLAHPGHELTVHAWLARAKPLVLVLTDGSGRMDEGRVESSRRVISAAGASPGPLFSRYSDRDIYHAILAGDLSFFLTLADEVAECLANHGIDFVASDAYEGVNPVHDLMREITASAVRLVREQGRGITHCEVFLFRRGDDARDEDAALTVRLTDAEYDRKIEEARRYPELAAEINAVLDGRLREFFDAIGADPSAEVLAMDASAYRTEVFSRPAEWEPVEERFYDVYGQNLAARGIHEAAISYECHILPIERALRQHTHANSHYKQLAR